MEQSHHHHHHLPSRHRQSRIKRDSIQIRISLSSSSTWIWFIVFLVNSGLWCRSHAQRSQRLPTSSIIGSASSSSSSSYAASGSQKVTFGAILPKMEYQKRAFYKKFTDAVDALTKGTKHTKFNFTKYYHISQSQAQIIHMSLNPSPIEVLEALCQQLLTKDVSTIIYMTNSDGVIDRNAAQSSAQYLMQLTGYLGIPMIAWNSDNIGLEQVRLFDHFITFTRALLVKIGFFNTLSVSYSFQVKAISYDPRVLLVPHVHVFTVHIFICLMKQTPSMITFFLDIILLLLAVHLFASSLHSYSDFFLISTEHRIHHSYSLFLSFHSSIETKCGFKSEDIKICLEKLNV